MTYAERNLLKGRTGSICLPIPIIHGTAREGIAAVPHNLPILHREGVPACEGRSELALQSENIITDSPTQTATNPSTIRSQSPKSATTMTSPERKRMPQRGERRAPVFTGESEELPRFFDGVEVAAEEAGLRDKEMMIWACRCK